MQTKYTKLEKEMNETNSIHKKTTIDCFTESLEFKTEVELHLSKILINMGLDASKLKLDVLGKFKHAIKKLKKLNFERM